MDWNNRKGQSFDSTPSTVSIKALEIANNELTETLKLSQKEIGRLSNAGMLLQEKYRQQSKLLQTANKQNDDLRNANDVLCTTEAQLTTQLQIVNVQMNDMKTEISSGLHALLAEKVANDLISEVVAAMKNQVYDLECLNLDLKNNCTIQYPVNSEELQGQVQHTTGNIEEYMSRVIMLEKKLQEKQEDYSFMLQALEAELADNRNETERVTVAYRKSQVERAAETLIAFQTVQRADQLQAQVMKFQSAIAELKQPGKTQKEIIGQLEMDLAIVGEDLIDSNTRVIALEAEIDALHRQLELKESECHNNPIVARLELDLLLVKQELTTKTLELKNTTFELNDLNSLFVETQLILNCRDEALSVAQREIEEHLKSKDCNPVQPLTLVHDEVYALQKEVQTQKLNVIEANEAVISVQLEIEHLKSQLKTVVQSNGELHMSLEDSLRALLAEKIANDLTQDTLAALNSKLHDFAYQNEGLRNTCEDYHARLSLTEAIPLSTQNRSNSSSSQLENPSKAIKDGLKIDLDECKQSIEFITYDSSPLELSTVRLQVIIRELQTANEDLLASKKSYESIYEKAMYLEKANEALTFDLCTSRHKNELLLKEAIHLDKSTHHVDAVEFVSLEISKDYSTQKSTLNEVVQDEQVINLNQKSIELDVPPGIHALLGTILDESLKNRYSSESVIQEMKKAMIELHQADTSQSLLMTELAFCRGEMKRLECQVETLCNVNIAQKASITELENEMSKNREKLIDSPKRETASKRVIVDLHAELVKYEVEKANFESREKINALEYELQQAAQDRLQSDLELLQDELIKSQNELITTARELSELQINTKSIELHCSSLTDQLHRSTVVIMEQQHTNELLSKDFTHLRDNNALKVDTLRRLLSEALEALAAEKVANDLLLEENFKSLRLIDNLRMNHQVISLNLQTIENARVEVESTLSSTEQMKLILEAEVQKLRSDLSKVNDTNSHQYHAISSSLSELPPLIEGKAQAEYGQNTCDNVSILLASETSSSSNTLLQALNFSSALLQQNLKQNELIRQSQEIDRTMHQDRAKLQDNEVKMLYIELTKAQEQCRRIAPELAVAHGEIAKLNDEVIQLNSELTTLNSVSTLQKEQLQNLHSEMHQLRYECKDMSKQAVTAMNVNAGLTSEVNVLERLRMEQVQETEMFKNKLNDAQVTVAKKEQEVYLINSLFEETESKFKVRIIELEGLLNEANVKLSAGVAAIDLMYKEISELTKSTDEVAHLNKNLSVMQNMSEGQREKLRQYEDELSRLRSELAASVSSAARLDGEVSLTEQSRMAFEQSLKSELETTLRALTAEKIANEFLSDGLAKKESELARWMSERSSSSSKDQVQELLAAAEKLGRLESEKVNLIDLLAKSKSDIDQVKTEVEGVKTRYKEQGDKLAKAEEAIAALALELSSKKHELELLSQTLSHVQSESASKLVDMQRLLEEALSRADKSAKDVSELTKLEGILSERQSLLAAANSQISQLEGRVSATEQLLQLEKLSSQNGTLSSQYHREDIDTVKKIELINSPLRLHASIDSTYDTKFFDLQHELVETMQALVAEKIANDLMHEILTKTAIDASLLFEAQRMGLKFSQQTDELNENLQKHLADTRSSSNLLSLEINRLWDELSKSEKIKLLADETLQRNIVLESELNELRVENKIILKENSKLALDLETEVSLRLQGDKINERLQQNFIESTNKIELLQEDITLLQGDLKRSELVHVASCTETAASAEQARGKLKEEMLHIKKVLSSREKLQDELQKLVEEKNEQIKNLSESLLKLKNDLSKTEKALYILETSLKGALDKMTLTEESLCLAKIDRTDSTAAMQNLRTEHEATLRALSAEKLTTNFAAETSHKTDENASRMLDDCSRPMQRYLDLTIEGVTKLETLKCKNDMLESSLVELRKNYDEVLYALVHEKCANDLLAETAASITYTNLPLLAKNEELERDLKSSLTTNEILSQEISRLWNEVNLSEASRLAAGSQLLASQRVVSEQGLEIKDVRNALQAAQENIHESSANITELTSCLHEKLSFIQMNEVTIASLLNDQSEARHLNDTLLRQIGSLQGQLNEMEHKLAVSTMDVVGCNENILLLTSELEKLSSQSKADRTQLSILTIELNDVSSQLKAETNALLISNESNESYRFELADKCHELELAWRNSTVLQESLNKAEIDLKSIIARLLPLEMDNHELTQSLGTSLKHSNEREAKLELERNNVRHDYEKILDKYTNTFADMEILKNENKIQLERLQSQAEEIDKLSDQLFHAEFDVQRLMKIELLLQDELSKQAGIHEQLIKELSLSTEKTKSLMKDIEMNEQIFEKQKHESLVLSDLIISKEKAFELNEMEYLKSLEVQETLRRHICSIQGEYDGKMLELSKELESLHMNFASNAASFELIQEENKAAAILSAHQATALEESWHERLVLKAELVHKVYEFDNLRQDVIQDKQLILAMEQIENKSKIRIIELEGLLNEAHVKLSAGVAAIDLMHDETRHSAVEISRLRFDFTACEQAQLISSNTLLATKQSLLELESELCDLRSELIRSTGDNLKLSCDYEALTLLKMKAEDSYTRLDMKHANESLQTKEKIDTLSLELSQLQFELKTSEHARLEQTNSYNESKAFILSALEQKNHGFELVTKDLYYLQDEHARSMTKITRLEAESISMTLEINLLKGELIDAHAMISGLSKQIETTTAELTLTDLSLLETQQKYQASILNNQLSSSEIVKLVEELSISQQNSMTIEESLSEAHKKISELEISLNELALDPSDSTSTARIENIDKTVNCGSLPNTMPLLLKSISITGLSVDELPCLEVWDVNGPVFSSYEGLVSNKYCNWSAEYGDGAFEIGKDIIGDFSVLCRFGGKHSIARDRTTLIFKYQNSTAFLPPDLVELKRQNIDVSPDYSDHIDSDMFKMKLNFEQPVGELGKTKSNLLNETEMKISVDADAGAIDLMHEERVRLNTITIPELASIQCDMKNYNEIVVETLETELKQVRQSLEQALHDKSLLQEAVVDEKLLREFEILKSENISLNESLTASLIEQASVMDELNRVKIDLTQLKQDYQEAISKAIRLEGFESSNTVSTIANYNQKLLKDIESLQAELEKSKYSLESTLRSKDKLIKAIETLQSDKNTHQQLLEKISEENVFLKDALSSNDVSFRSLALKNSNLEADYISKETLFNALIIKNNELTSEISIIQVEFEKSLTKLKASKEMISELEGMTAKLSEDYTHLSNLIDEKKEKYKKRSEESLNKITMLEKSLEVANAELASYALTLKRPVGSQRLVTNELRSEGNSQNVQLSSIPNSNELEQKLARRRELNGESELDAVINSLGTGLGSEGNISILTIPARNSSPLKAGFSNPRVIHQSSPHESKLTIKDNDESNNINFEIELHKAKQDLAEIKQYASEQILTLQQSLREAFLRIETSDRAKEQILVSFGETTSLLDAELSEVKHELSKSHEAFTFLISKYKAAEESIMDLQSKIDDKDLSLHSSSVMNEKLIAENIRLRHELNCIDFQLHVRTEENLRCELDKITQTLNNTKTELIETKAKLYETDYFKISNENQSLWEELNSKDALLFDAKSVLMEANLEIAQLRITNKNLKKNELQDAEALSEEQNLSEGERLNQSDLLENALSHIAELEAEIISMKVDVDDNLALPSSHDNTMDMHLCKLKDCVTSKAKIIGLQVQLNKTQDLVNKNEDLISNHVRQLSELRHQLKDCKCKHISERTTTGDLRSIILRTGPRDAYTKLSACIRGFLCRRRIQLKLRRIPCVLSLKLDSLRDLKTSKSQNEIYVIANFIRFSSSGEYSCYSTLKMTCAATCPENMWSSDIHHLCASSENGSLVLNVFSKTFGYFKDSLIGQIVVSLDQYPVLLTRQKDKDSINVVLSLPLAAPILPVFQETGREYTISKGDKVSDIFGSISLTVQVPSIYKNLCGQFWILNKSFFSSKWERIWIVIFRNEVFIFDSPYEEILLKKFSVTFINSIEEIVNDIRAPATEGLILSLKFNLNSEDAVVIGWGDEVALMKGLWLNAFLNSARRSKNTGTGL